MDFLTILATAVVTSAAAQFFVVAKDRYLLNRESKFSMLYAALFFERYAEACSTHLSEKEAFERSSGHAGIDHGGLADLREFPPEIDWRHVGIRLTEKAFAFRVDHALAAAYISEAYDVDPPDGGDQDVKTRSIELGLIALALASELRAAAKLPIPAYVANEYSARRHLEARKAEYDSRKKAIADLT